MKYSEFREYLKSNDFGMRENDEMIIADDQFEISKRVQCSIWFLRDNIEYSYEYELLKKAIELAETPLDEKMKQVIKYKAPYELIKGHETDSGYDVKLDTRSLFIKPFMTVKLPTGIYLDLPYNYEVQVRPKSGLSSKGLLIHLGTVDSDYRGEVLVIATNLTNKPFALRADEKIAQLVFVKKDIVELEQVGEISNNTTRGTGGFGSTGRF